MKKLILFLLLFCSIYSFGEELTKEQQKTAWKFIYKSMLWNFHQQKYDRPNIFTKDIKINLQGKITSSDSIYVENLIRDIDKAIPHFKIGLSDSLGNLVMKVGLDDENSIIVGTTKENGRSSYATSFPDNLSPLSKQKFLYYHLFQGLVGFRYISKPVNYLEGCVYNVANFDSVAFSPFDLFILKKLYSPDFSIQLAQNLDPELEQTAWNSIRDKFMGRLSDPLIFQSYIFIKLLGKVSQQDSVIFDKIINELNELLPANNQFVYTNSDANLTFSINNEPRAISTESLKTNKNYLTIRNVKFNIPEAANDKRRMKIIYYYLYRSLVHFSPAYGTSLRVPGCVFDEERPEAITFHPFDKFILHKLYAPDFQNQFKANFLRSNSLIEYYRFRFKDRLAVIGILGGFVLSILFVSILILMNVFGKHQWNFRVFIIQVVWGIMAYNLFFLFNNMVQDSYLDRFALYSLLIADLMILAVAITSFFAEKKIQFSSLSSKAKTSLLLIDTIVISYLISFLFVRFVTNETGYNLILIPVFIMLSITSARFFIISLSGISKAEIKQKDIELTRLRAENKQAELQSLRAKINPHFLYNSLNSIASLASSDAHKTEQMALALSDFFKYAINREQKQLNTLSEELNATRTYLNIEKVRFGDRLRFEIDCPAELLDIQIPQLLIQPLVENAIKHGLSQITDDGLIRIVVTKVESRLNIRVYDNGPAFPDGPLSGFGIRNTQERIMLLYGDKAAVNWTNVPEKYIMISLPFPKSNQPNTK